MACGRAWTMRHPPYAIRRSKGGLRNFGAVGQDIPRNETLPALTEVTGVIQQENPADPSVQLDLVDGRVVLLEAEQVSNIQPERKTEERLDHPAVRDHDQVGLGVGIPHPLQDPDDATLEGPEILPARRREGERMRDAHPKADLRSEGH